MDFLQIRILVIFLIMAPHFCTTDEISSCELRTILGLPSCEEDNQISNQNITSYEFCKIPSQYIRMVKKTLKCNLFQKYNPTCSENITISLTNLSPYVETHKDGSVHGLLIRKLFYLHKLSCYIYSS